MIGAAGGTGSSQAARNVSISLFVGAFAVYASLYATQPLFRC